MKNQLNFEMFFRLQRPHGLHRWPRQTRGVSCVIYDVIRYNGGRDAVATQPVRGDAPHQSASYVIGTPPPLSSWSSPNGWSTAAAATAHGRRPAGNSDRRTSRSDPDTGIGIGTFPKRSRQNSFPGIGESWRGLLGKGHFRRNKV